MLAAWRAGRCSSNCHGGAGYAWPRASLPVPALPTLQDVNIPWGDSRCILCCRVARLTDEYIIPDYLGGRLAVPFLCGSCNSLLGQKVDPSAAKDPYVREAVLRLGAIGEPFKSQVLDGMPWLARTTGGPRKMLFTRKRGIDMLPYRDEAGALNMPTVDAKATIVRMLAKAGATVLEIAAALDAFEAAPNDCHVELGYGDVVFKSQTLAVTPVFEGPQMDDLLALKVAYEFMALHLEERVFNACFDPIREALLTGDRTRASGAAVVSRLLADQQDPVHGLALEQAAPSAGGHAVVHIRFFGRPTWRVAFPRLRYSGQRVVATQDLVTGEVHLGRAT